MTRACVTDFRIRFSRALRQRGSATSRNEFPQDKSHCRLTPKKIHFTDAPSAYAKRKPSLIAAARNKAVDRPCCRGHQRTEMRSPPEACPWTWEQALVELKERT